MTDVTLPSLGESVTEGIITRWFKKVGDQVSRDEPLFEVSTDKVDSEMPSPASGVLAEILAAEGDTVETGSRVAVINEGAISKATPTGADPAPPSPTAPSARQVEPAPPPFPTPSEVSGVVVSPVVRRILADAGVDPGAVRGSGPGGSITRRDAERAVANGPTDDVVVPLSHGRLRMGQHMMASSQTAPHGFVAVDVDASVFDRLDAVGRVTRDGVPVSDEVVVGLAAVRALGEFEHLNATFADDELVVHRTVNLGFQRAIDGEGMLVPVVHAAAGLTLRSLARRVAEVTERMASRHLTTDDLMGGTFTIVGAPSPHTVVVFPIIVQPEVAILSVGAVRREAVVVERDGVNVVEPGRRVVLGLAFDHRVSEPASAAAYLERVAELLAGIDIESER